MTRHERTEMQIEECYNHLENYFEYLEDEECTTELREMCKKCENYCGATHDFSECKDRQCFRFWLAYEYLEWANSYRYI